MKLHPTRRALVALVALAACTVPVGCGRDSSSDRATTSGVATTFYPLTDFAQRLIGPEVDVRCPLPSGEDTIFWQPDTEAMSVFRSARLIVSNGAEFEKWLASASLPESRHVRTADGFKDQFIHFATGINTATAPQANTNTSASTGTRGSTRCSRCCKCAPSKALSSAPSPNTRVSCTTARTCSCATSNSCTPVGPTSRRA